YNAAWGFKLVTFSINNCIENIELNENGILLRGKTSSNERKIILFSERSNEQVAIPITYDNGHFEFLISKKIYETFLKKSKQEEYDELLCFKFKDVGTLKHNLDKELILHSLGNQWQLTIMS